MRGYLIKNSIYLPVHWPLAPDTKDPIAKSISDEIISIVIDQRYEKEDIERQIEEIVKGIEHAGVKNSRKLG